MREALLMGQPGAGKSAIREVLVRSPGVGLAVYEVPGLIDTPLATAELRRQQGWALGRMAAGGAVVLHVVDAGRVGEQGVAALGAADWQLVALGQSHLPAYALVAAQMDRPWAAAGLRILAERLRPPVLIPASAQTGQGVGGLLRYLRQITRGRRRPLAGRE